MRTGRAARTLLLAVPATSLFLSASCRSLQPLDAGAPVPTGAVRVQFAAPRELLAVSRGGDTIALGGVRALRGRVDAERGDTLAVRVDSVWGTPPPGPAAAASRWCGCQRTGWRCRASRNAGGPGSSSEWRRLRSWPS
jgi:hypothetical protein